MPGPVRVLTSHTVALAVGADDALPTEFCIFRAGVNATTKGPVLFDATAAAAVMSSFSRRGVDLAIDLAHDSMNEAARAHRSDADDARGWFRLELRGGELWAVGVSWTPDGARRLRERTQRYISPVVAIDPKDRALEILSAALCSQPATLHAAPLVATREIAPVRAGSAAPRIRSLTMDPKLIKEALDALEAGDSGKALEILKALIASAAGAPADPAPAPEPTAETADPVATGAALTTLTAEVRTLAATGAAQRKALAEAQATIKALQDERNGRELEERRTLVGDLVRLGAETPATAWAGDAAQRNPVKRLADEPLADLRTRVIALRAANPKRETVAAPERGALQLSDIEQATYEGLPSDKAKTNFMARRALRRGASVQA